MWTLFVQNSWSVVVQLIIYFYYEIFVIFDNNSVNNHSNFFIWRVIVCNYQPLFIDFSITNIYRLIGQPIVDFKICNVDFFMLQKHLYTQRKSNIALAAIICYCNVHYHLRFRHKYRRNKLVIYKYILKELMFTSAHNCPNLTWN